MAIAFKNSLTRQMADKPLKQIYPEFDIISLSQMCKPLYQMVKRIQMTKSYTGVPAKFADGTDKLKSELFGEYNKEVWTTTSKSAAKAYSQGGFQDGKVFTIFGNTKKLAKLPETHHAVIWSNMPYKFNNGKFRIDPNAKPMLYQKYFHTENGLEKPLITITDDGWKALQNASPSTTTGMLFDHAIKNNYNGIIIKKCL